MAPTGPSIDATWPWTSAGVDHSIHGSKPATFPSPHIGCRYLGLELGQCQHLSYAPKAAASRLLPALACSEMAAPLLRCDPRRRAGTAHTHSAASASYLLALGHRRQSPLNNILDFVVEVSFAGWRVFAVSKALGGRRTRWSLVRCSCQCTQDRRFASFLW